MEIRGITIHNTGTSESAREMYDILQANHRLNYCHFLVDENEVVQTLSLDENAWHTGKGRDFGNMYTIAIEICRSTTDLYSESEERAVNLVKNLMADFGLTRDNVFFHNSFDHEAFCPHRILGQYTLEEWKDKYL